MHSQSFHPTSIHFPLSWQLVYYYFNLVLFGGIVWGIWVLFVLDYAIVEVSGPGEIFWAVWYTLVFKKYIWAVGLDVIYRHIHKIDITCSLRSITPRSLPNTQSLNLSTTNPPYIINKLYTMRLADINLRQNCPISDSIIVECMVTLIFSGILV